MRTLLIALGVLFGIYVVLVLTLLIAGRRTAAREVALLLPNLLFLFKDLAKDPRVPRRSRWLLVVGAAWVASPIDLIPEFSRSSDRWTMPWWLPSSCATW
jgi:hypothetical protein